MLASLEEHTIQNMPSNESATSTKPPPEQSTILCNDSAMKKNQKNILFELLLEFMDTLPGLKYVAERGTSVVEKLFWIIAFAICVFLSVVLMCDSWVKWQTMPIIITLNDRLISVNEIPFPAVTICPQAKIRQRAYNYTKHTVEFLKLFIEIDEEANGNLSLKQENLKILVEQNPFISELLDFDLVCGRRDKFNDCNQHTTYTAADNVECSNHDETEDWGKFTKDYTAVDNILKAAPQLEDIMTECAWQNKLLNSTEVFGTVLMKEGLCFTFNSLSVNEIFRTASVQLDYLYLNAFIPLRRWSLDRGYFNNKDDHYPRRGRENSLDPDLIVGLRDILDRDTLCDGFNRGFKVYLHHPADLPQSSLHYYTVLPEQLASFAIKANVMLTSTSLVDFSPFVRQCYFPSEKKLRYFKMYTLNNCQLECSANYTLARCGCAWFHMPHNDSRILCNALMHKCVISALEEYATNGNDGICECLPLCNNVQYEAEVSKTSFNGHAYTEVVQALWDEVNNYTQTNSDDKNYRIANSKIEMYFKEPQFLSIRRSQFVISGLTDFLANCGGLLGLFLGFPFISIIEFFYFFTLRLGCMLVRKEVNK